MTAPLEFAPFTSVDFKPKRTLKQRILNRDRIFCDKGICFRLARFGYTSSSTAEKDIFLRCEKHRTRGQVDMKKIRQERRRIARSPMIVQ